MKSVPEDEASGRTSVMFILGVTVGAGVPLLMMLATKAAGRVKRYFFHVVKGASRIPLEDGFPTWVRSRKAEQVAVEVIISGSDSA